MGDACRAKHNTVVARPGRSRLIVCGRRCYWAPCLRSLSLLGGDYLLTIWIACQISRRRTTNRTRRTSNPFISLVVGCPSKKGYALINSIRCGSRLSNEDRSITTEFHSANTHRRCRPARSGSEVVDTFSRDSHTGVEEGEREGEHKHNCDTHHKFDYLLFVYHDSPERSTPNIVCVPIFATCSALQIDRTRCHRGWQQPNRIVLRLPANICYSSCREATLSIEDNNSGKNTSSGENVTTTNRQYQRSWDRECGISFIDPCPLIDDKSCPSG